MRSTDELEQLRRRGIRELEALEFDGRARPLSSLEQRLRDKAKDFIHAMEEEIRLRERSCPGVDGQAVGMARRSR